MTGWLRDHPYTSAFALGPVLAVAWTLTGGLREGLSVGFGVWIGAAWIARCS